MERLTTLRTRVMREREEKRNMKQYRFTLIRVRFPDELILQVLHTYSRPFIYFEQWEGLKWFCRNPNNQSELHTDKFSLLGNVWNLRIFQRSNILCSRKPGGSICPVSFLSRSIVVAEAFNARREFILRPRSGPGCSVEFRS